MPLPAQFDSPRPGTEHRKRTLDVISKGLALDKQRTGASIALLKSGQMRISAVHGKSFSSRSPLEVPAICLGISPRPGTGVRPGTGTRPGTGEEQPRIHSRKSTQEMLSTSLAEAWNTHVKNFDRDGDGTIGIDEMITLLTRCEMFDDWLTPSKVRAYFLALFEGCNHTVRSKPGMTTQRLAENIGYSQFEAMLHWAADLKGVNYSKCVWRLVNETRKTCDKSSSRRCRLEVVFETFCKCYAGRMTVFEFAGLCQKFGVYKDARFCNGDVHILFQIYGSNQTVDFEGFMRLIAEISERLDMGEQLYNRFADAAENLGADEGIIAKVRLSMKAAAQCETGRNWVELLRNQDSDGSGQISWDEFRSMCRKVFKLTDQDIHLRYVFQKLDGDDSGEISIEELINFVQDADALMKMRSLSLDPKSSTLPANASPRYYSARYQINMDTRDWAYMSDRPVSSYHQQHLVSPHKIVS